MRFESPYMLLLLAVIPVLIWLRVKRCGRGSIRFSSIHNAGRSGVSLRQSLTGIPFLTRLLVILLLTVALARPQQGKERVHDVSKGVAIEMVVDRSGSMAAEMEYAGSRLNRLEVVKRVFTQFVHGDGDDLPGRPNDLVGMIAFARYADTVCPLTLGHGALSQFLENIKLVPQRSKENATSIGDAVALAAARLKTAEATMRKQSGKKDREYEIKSKIVILLTDGENNAGRRTVEEAAEIASEWGIKVYAIGVGGGESVAVMRTPLGNFKVPGRGGGVNEHSLRQLAEDTGGLFRLAEDAESLKAVYQEIDEMERSNIESVRYMDYKEKFVPLVCAAAALLLLETLLNCTLFRRIP